MKERAWRIEGYPLLLSILYLLSSILCLLPACIATVTPPPPVVLKAAGSTSMGPLLTDLASAYSSQHPHVTFDIQGGGSRKTTPPRLPS